MGAAGLVPLVEEYAHRYVERGRTPADDVPADADASPAAGASGPAAHEHLAAPTTTSEEDPTWHR
jgi:glutamate--cysteine ligase